MTAPNPWAMDAPATPAPAPAPAPYSPPSQTAAAPFATAPAVPTQPTAPPAPAGYDDDPFDAPAPQEPRGPRLTDIPGRLVMICPRSQETVTKIDDKTKLPKQVERMTADLIILDGPPIAYGGKPEGRPPTPHTQVAQVPHVNKAMWIEAVAIVSQCRNALAKRRAGGRGMVLGRLGYGEAKPGSEKQAPWILVEATEDDKVIARAYLARHDPFVD